MWYRHWSLLTSCILSKLNYFQGYWLYLHKNLKILPTIPLKPILLWLERKHLRDNPLNSSNSMICITISMWTSRTEFIIGTKATWIFMIGMFRVLLLGVHDNFPTWILLTARLVLSILLYKFISNVIALICLH